MQRNAPYVLLLVLLTILVFIVGIKYGKKVEQTNKTIDYLISTTPKPSTTPNPTKPMAYKTYTHKGCGVEFVYPSSLKVSKESSQEAVLIDSKPQLTLFCGNAVGRSATPEGFIQKKVRNPNSLKNDSLYC